MTYEKNYKADYQGIRINGQSHGRFKMKLDFLKKDERIEFRLSPSELKAFMEEAKKVKANKTQFFRFLLEFYLESKRNEGKK